jgi:hypothetical protein
MWVQKTRRTGRRGLEHVHQASPHFIPPSIHHPSNGLCLFSTKKLDIQPNSSHEQVDVAKSLPAHILRQRLANSNSLHNTLLDTNNKSLLLVGAGAHTHGGEELPDVNVVRSGDTGVGGEDVRQQWLDSVEEARVQFRPLDGVFLLFARGLCGGDEGLLDELGAGDEHCEDGDAGLGADGGEDVDPVQDEAEKANDDVEGGLVDVAEEGRHDGLGKKFDLLLDSGWDGGVVVGRVCFTDDIEDVEVDDHEGEHSETLLLVEVAEDAWDGLLAFAVGEDLYEGVLGRLAVKG